MELKTIIKCPECGYKKEETMPTDIFQIIYTCEKCGALLKPEKGDDCVFCSYGSEECPQRQKEKKKTESEEFPQHPFLG